MQYFHCYVEQNKNNMSISLTGLHVSYDITITGVCGFLRTQNASSWTCCICTSPKNHYKLFYTGKNQTPRYTQRGQQEYSTLLLRETLKLVFAPDGSITRLCGGICFFAKPSEVQLHADFTNGGNLCFP